MRSTLAFAGSVATLVLLVGAQDLESYDHAFFSLDRGTAADSVQFLGQPVFTLALGLGVRLPLHGSLGASPAAAVAPCLPAPLTYWLLLTLSISAAVAVVRQALEPLSGRVVAWLAAALLFCSPPIVNYTIFDDWPETAVTYCAVVACVFAPHALLAARPPFASSRLRTGYLGSLLVTGTVWGLVGLAHPGYWPLLAGTIVLALALSLSRSEYPARARLTAVILLAAVTSIAVALQVPDILREISAAAAREPGELRRIVDGPAGQLVPANLFPFRQGGARGPFTFLVLALVSLVAGLASNDHQRRRLMVADLWQAGDRSPWTHDLTSPDERLSRRGLPRDRVPPGGRLALWPGVADGMRNARRPSVDFADAGYPLVTVWMKQRTMRGFLEPNDLLFNQTTDFGPEALCDPDAVGFLQLRYLVMPGEVECAPWSRMPGVLVDGSLQVGVASEPDDRVRAVPVARLAEPFAREPAFSPGFRLGSMLMPLSGTSLTLTTRGVRIRLDSPSAAADRALVLPVAYDPAWRASSGQVHSVGGLLALVGVAQREVIVEFVPDTTAVLRALSMTVAQLLTVVGLVGLAFVRSPSAIA